MRVKWFYHVVWLTALGLGGWYGSIAADSTPSTAPASQGRREATGHWSFQPFHPATPPVPKAKGWIKTPIDAFVLAKLEQNHLRPAPPASRLALLRRAYFDLIGLPPKPDEIEAFSKSTSPKAYAELIERLLASPHYGERWGRHWLDVVRYADSGGSETDLLYQNAWKYRDYVIRSLNADKPFDRFIQEQVAGDELWPGDEDAATATALYSIGPVLEESAMVSNQLEYEWLTDAADTTGAAFLGLTVGCARCHNHKYDPIPQRDYYALQAIFAASQRVYPEPVRDLRIKALNGLLAEKPLPDDLKQDPRCLLKTEKEEGLRLVHLETPMEVRVLRRGELSKPGAVVEPGVLSALASGAAQPDLSDVPATQRRAALARWLTSPEENPLTARVIVNRVWAWHFGQGIVRTPNDFGTQGDPPTHPDLLDWLASDFIEHGWSLKHLHRLIMLSSAYQQTSVAAEESPKANSDKSRADVRSSKSGGPYQQAPVAAGEGRRAEINQSLVTSAATGAMEKDPENRLLWHFPRRRLDGETIWDSLQACAGTLNLTLYGPPVVPPLTDEELAALFNAKQKWKVTQDPNEHSRRGVYLVVRRTFLFPLFEAFDPPEVMTSCARRLETTVPTQALALLNSRVAEEQARAFAARLLKECAGQPKKIVARVWLLAFNRPITKSEATRAVAFLHDRQTALARAGSAPNPPPLQEALTEFCLALFNANEFTYVD